MGVASSGWGLPMVGGAGMGTHEKCTHISV